MTMALATSTSSAPGSTPPSRLQRLRAQIPLPLWIGGGITLVWILLAVLAPLLTSFDPIKVDVMQSLKVPGGAHLLGTDAIGRGLFARVLCVARAVLPGPRPAHLFLLTAGGQLGQLPPPVAPPGAGPPQRRLRVGCAGD